MGDGAIVSCTIPLRSNLIYWMDNKNILNFGGYHGTTKGYREGKYALGK
jgi:hypothetical protein